MPEKLITNIEAEKIRGWLVAIGAEQIDQLDPLEPFLGSWLVGHIPLRRESLVIRRETDETGGGPHILICSSGQARRLRREVGISFLKGSQPGAQTP